MKAVRLVVEQHVDYFLVYLPAFMITGRGSTLQQAIENFRKYYKLYAPEVAEDKFALDDLLDVYITETTVNIANEEAQTIAV